MGRPVKYLVSRQVSKEEIARGLAAKDRIRDGLVRVLRRVEPRCRECLFLYHYRMLPVSGFLNARIQTWVSFRVRICLNGRQCLAR